MARHNGKMTQWRAFSVVPQPYYLKKTGMNDFLGVKHDGHSTGYLEGYSVKPIHFLNRFRHNEYQFLTPWYVKNPPGKDKHWLEVTIKEKVVARLNQEEAWGGVVLCLLIVPFTLWQLGWYFLYHPEYNLYVSASPPMKHMSVMSRTEALPSLDKPIFRWFQRQTEFYGYEAYRELIRMEVIANDPYIEWAKKNGRYEELKQFPEEWGWGKGKKNKLSPVEQLQKDALEFSVHHQVRNGPFVPHYKLSPNTENWKWVKPADDKHEDKAHH